MRLILSLFILFSAVCSQPAKAEPKRYMVCLAKEEAMIHKKNFGGPVYKLNQELISALVQLTDSIYMKKRYVSQVCKASYPSIKLLELLLSEKAVFFSRFTKERQPKLLAVDESIMKDLKRDSAGLFVSFVTKIQAGLSKPNCLQKHIPELNDFFEKMQFLQENMGLESIVEAIRNPKVVFEKLQKLDYKNIKC